MNIFNLGYKALMQDDPELKITQVKELQKLIASDHAEFDPLETVNEIPIPGRPLLPELVHPAKVARRKLTTVQGRIALIHAVCHIEFNAINLALDAIYRFQYMPKQYYSDWIKVASEESKHFLLLRDRLLTLQAQYGDLPAHNGLWEMAIKTQHSVVERMALVPRVLEARGLDVTPGMIDRLKAVNDLQTIEILELILQEEVGHVEIGTRWFRFSCENENLNPESTFISLLDQYNVSTGNSTLHLQARKKAGFTSKEIDALM